MINFFEVELKPNVDELFGNGLSPEEVRLRIESFKGENGLKGTTKDLFPEEHAQWQKLSREYEKRKAEEKREANRARLEREVSPAFQNKKNH